MSLPPQHSNSSPFDDEDSVPYTLDSTYWDPGSQASGGGSSMYEPPAEGDLLGPVGPGWYCHCCEFFMICNAWDWSGVVAPEVSQPPYQHVRVLTGAS